MPQSKESPLIIKASIGLFFNNNLNASVNSNSPFLLIGVLSNNGQISEETTYLPTIAKSDGDVPGAGYSSMSKIN